MENVYPLLKFLHVIAFVFMSVPLFNLIVVNERAQLGTPFNFYADRYLENIIRRGATRCFTFQATVLTTGVLLLVYGPLDVATLWNNGMLLAKTILLFVLMSLLSFVHLSLQPKIEAIMGEAKPEEPVSDDFLQRLRPPRVLRKKLATLCLFVVIVTIIMGMQVYSRYSLGLNIVLIALAGVFTLRVNKTLVRFGWI
ncbi:MAG: hypothetical protein OEZ54_07285 [Gemmatimonadota bacterium]|nr:hypothetical protein [Gemmatimonadota bacterium]